jgi:hypothetical protein
MKTIKWIRIVLSAAILGYLAYDISTVIADAHDYYSNHKSALLAAIFVAPLLGIIVLVYRDKVTNRVKTLHALLATTILAAVITAFATILSRTLWAAFEFTSATLQDKLLGSLALIMLYGVAAGLWWYAIVLWKKHRTSGCSLRRTTCAVPEP